MSEELNTEEPEIVVEEPDQESDQESKVEVAAEAAPSDELDSYSKGVQTRIKKLTEKYRQEERDKSEAVRLSQQLLDER